jgi:thiamine biosynthesis protein ThiS
LYDERAGSSSIGAGMKTSDKYSERPSGGTSGFALQVATGFCYVVCMRLVINGEERNYSAATLDALIEELGMKGDRVAVELNREIMPRENWSATALQEGDKLEIVHFVGGGRT